MHGHRNHTKNRKPPKKKTKQKRGKGFLLSLFTIPDHQYLLFRLVVDMPVPEIESYHKKIDGNGIEERESHQRNRDLGVLLHETILLLKNVQSGVSARPPFGIRALRRSFLMEAVGKTAQRHSRALGEMNSAKNTPRCFAAL